MDAAAGAIATSRDKLRTMLSKCTYWQQFGGASYTEAQALARIYLDGMPFLDDLLSDPTNRPLAVIGRDEMESWLEKHPQGRVVAYLKKSSEAAAVQAEFSQPYLDGAVVLLDKTSVRRMPGGGK